MSDRLATIDMARKMGAAVPLFVGELEPVAWIDAYPSTKWHLDPSSRLATKTWAEKWGTVPLFRRLWVTI